MGMILLPLFLAMLFGFTSIGIVLGVRAVLKAKGRVSAILVLSLASAGLSLAGIVLPFALAASARVSAGGFPLLAMSGVGGAAALGGTFLHLRYGRTGAPIHGICAAACFLAGGAFPVMWFWLSERMSTWFQVGWMY